MLPCCSLPAPLCCPLPAFSITGDTLRGQEQLHAHRGSARAALLWDPPHSQILLRVCWDPQSGVCRQGPVTPHSTRTHLAPASHVHNTLVKASPTGDLLGPGTIHDLGFKSNFIMCCLCK